MDFSSSSSLCKEKDCFELAEHSKVDVIIDVSYDINVKALGRYIGEEYGRISLKIV